MSGQELVPCSTTTGSSSPTRGDSALLEEHHPEPPLWPHERRGAPRRTSSSTGSTGSGSARRTSRAGRDPAKYGPRITAAQPLRVAARRARLSARRVRDRGRDRVSVRQVRDRQNPDDHSNFHQILRDWQPIDGRPESRRGSAAWMKCRAPRRRKRRARSARREHGTRAATRVEDRERTVAQRRRDDRPAAACTLWSRADRLRRSSRPPRCDAHGAAPAARDVGEPARRTSRAAAASLRRGAR